MTDPPIASTALVEPAPVAAQAASRRHRDLFERRSILGALGVLVVLCFFGFGLRAIDESQKTAGFEVGTGFDVSDTVSFTPASGWSVDKSATNPGSVVTLTRNGVTTKILSLTLQPTATLESFAKIFHDSDKQSDSYTDVTDLETFTTASGVHGVKWSATGPTEATQNWIVAEDKTVASMRVNGSASDWSAIQADLDAMAESIALNGSKGGASQ